MINASRVIEVAKFLKCGEEWQRWIDHNDAYQIRIRANATDSFTVALSAMFKSEDGRYVHHIDRRFGFYEIDERSQKFDPEVWLAFELAQMEVKLLEKRV